MVGIPPYSADQAQTIAVLVAYHHLITWETAVKEAGPARQRKNIRADLPPRRSRRAGRKFSRAGLPVRRDLL